MPKLTRESHGPAVLRYLKVHGPSRFAQIQEHLRAELRDLDYDLRVLRLAGKIISRAGLWHLA